MMRGDGLGWEMVAAYLLPVVAIALHGMISAREPVQLPEGTLNFCEISSFDLGIFFIEPTTRNQYVILYLGYFFYIMAAH